MTDSTPILANAGPASRTWSTIGQRVGYGLFASPSSRSSSASSSASRTWITTLVTGSIIAGSLVLAPAIVFGYGVQAADRADRDGSWD